MITRQGTEGFNTRKLPPEGNKVRVLPFRFSAVIKSNPSELHFTEKVEKNILFVEHLSLWIFPFQTSIPLVKYGGSFWRDDKSPLSPGWGSIGGQYSV